MCKGNWVEVRLTNHLIGVGIHPSGDPLDLVCSGRLLAGSLRHLVSAKACGPLCHLVFLVSFHEHLYTSPGVEDGRCQPHVCGYTYICDIT